MVKLICLGNRQPSSTALKLVIPPIETITVLPFMVAFAQHKFLSNAAITKSVNSPSFVRGQMCKKTPRCSIILLVNKLIGFTVAFSNKLSNKRQAVVSILKPILYVIFYK